MTKIRYKVTKSKKLLDETGKHLINLDLKAEVFEYLYILTKDDIIINGLYYYHNIIHKSYFRWCTAYYTQYHTIIFKDNNEGEVNHSIYKKKHKYRFGKFDIISVKDYTFINGFPTEIEPFPEGMEMSPGQIEIAPGPFARFFLEVNPKSVEDILKIKTIIIGFLPTWAEVDFVTLPDGGVRFVSTAIMNLSWIKSVIANMPSFIDVRPFSGVIPSLEVFGTNPNNLITFIKNDDKVFTPNVTLINDTHLRYEFEFRFNKNTDTVTVLYEDKTSFYYMSLYCKELIYYNWEYCIPEHGKMDINIKSPPGFKVFITFKTTKLVPIKNRKSSESFIYAKKLTFCIDPNFPGTSESIFPENIMGNLSWDYILDLPDDFPFIDHDGTVILFKNMYYYKIENLNLLTDLNGNYYRQK